MRYLLLLLPLAAHAAASPCDPRCDPKAKAKTAAAVATCDPKARVQVVSAPGLTRASTSSPAVVVHGHAGGVAWHEIATAPSGAGASCTIASGSGGQSSCATKSGARATCTVTSSPSTTCAAHEVRAPSVASPNLSLPAHTASGFSSPGFTVEGFDVPAFTAMGFSGCGEADDEDEPADEDVAEAMEDLEELEELGAIELEDATAQGADSLPELAELVRQERADAERRAQVSQRDMQRALEAMHGSEYAEAMAQAANEGLLARGSYQKALAELARAGNGNRYFLAPRALATTEDGDSDDLESRVRALERIAREQGHAPTDGSLEERVAALERALGAGQSGKSGPARGQAPAKVYALGKDGLRAYKGADAEYLRELAGERASLAPTPASPAPPRVRRLRPVPAAPAAPVAPVEPFRLQMRERTPAPQEATAPRASSNEARDERREIEESMRTLREEAEQLRAELQRMRERIESLPRGER